MSLTIHPDLQARKTHPRASQETIMTTAHKLACRIWRAKKRAEAEGRLDDPVFQDWLDHMEEEKRRESILNYRQLNEDRIELGRGGFSLGDFDDD